MKATEAEREGCKETASTASLAFLVAGSSEYSAEAGVLSRARLLSFSLDDERSTSSLATCSLRLAFSARRASFSSFRRLATFCRATLRSISPCS